MHLQMNRKELLDSLKWTAKAAPGRQNVVPVLEHALLDARGDRVTLTVNNLDVAAEAKLEVAILDPGIGTFEIKPALAFLKSVKSQNVEIEISGEFATFTAGASQVVIASRDAEEFPKTPDALPAQYSIAASALQSAIDRVEPAISKEEIRHALTGALFEQSGEKLRVVATDSRRLTLVDLACLPVEPSAQSSVIVPRATLRLVDGLLTENVTIGIAGERLAIVGARRAIYSRAISNTFPNYRMVIPSTKDRPVLVMFDKSEAVATVKQLLPMTNKKTFGLRLTVNGSLELLANNEGTTSRSIIACETEGKTQDVTVGISGTFLRDAIECFTDDLVSMRLEDEAEVASQVLFQGAGAGFEFTTVVMPLRGE